MPNIFNLENVHSNNPWIKEETIKEDRKYFKLNYNKNTTHKNLWDAAMVKPLLREIFIDSNVYILQYKINTKIQPYNTRKKEIKPKVSRRKAVSKIRAELMK